MKWQVIVQWYDKKMEFHFLDDTYQDIEEAMTAYTLECERLEEKMKYKEARVGRVKLSVTNIMLEKEF